MFFLIEPVNWEFLTSVCDLDFCGPLCGCDEEDN